MSKLANQLYAKCRQILVLAKIPGALKLYLYFKGRGQKCQRCGTDLSHLVSLDNLPMTCHECQIAEINENLLSESKVSPLPVYDIDMLLDGTLRDWEVVDKLQQAIPRSLPDSKLFAAERLVRDYWDFSYEIGFTFDSILEKSSGAEIFMRGMRAMSTLGVEKLTRYMSDLKAFAESLGYTFPLRVPDIIDLIEDDHPDECSMVEDGWSSLAEEAERLENEYEVRQDEPDYNQIVFEYIVANAQELRARCRDV